MRPDLCLTSGMVAVRLVGRAVVVAGEGSPFSRSTWAKVARVREELWAWRAQTTDYHCAGIPADALARSACRGNAGPGRSVTFCLGAHRLALWSD